MEGPEGMQSNPPPTTISDISVQVYHFVVYLILELILLYRTCFGCKRQAFKLSELLIRSEDKQTTMPLCGLLS